MSNSIKYSTNPETLALKTGDFWIGTGDVPKGPTSTTGYWNGITPPSGGYTIYLNKQTGGPSIYIANNDAELIKITNQIANTSYNTVTECLTYYSTQNDKMVLNQDYPPIVTNGLILNLDAGFRPSYPTIGTTWTDLSGNGNNGTLVNGPTFDSTNGGSIVFDGVNDYINTNLDLSWNQTNSVTIIMVLASSNTSQNRGFIGKGPSNWEWQLNQRGSSLELVYWNTGGGHTNGPITSISNVFNNTQPIYISLVWNHIDNKHYFYKNGQNIGSNNWINGGINQNRTNTVNIGGDIYSWNMGGSYWQGTIYLTQIYNRALTSEEILQNFNATKGRFNL